MGQDRNLKSSAFSSSRQLGLVTGSPDPPAQGSSPWVNLTQTEKVTEMSRYTLTQPRPIFGTDFGPQGAPGKGPKGNKLKIAPNRPQIWLP